jgi:hypothetical protein
MKNILFLLVLFASHAMLFAQAEPTEKQAEQIAKIQQIVFKPLLAQFEADKTGQYKTMKADLEAVLKQEDFKAKQEMLARYQAQHYAFYKKNFTAARIDLTGYRR